MGACLSFVHTSHICAASHKIDSLSPLFQVKQAGASASRLMAPDNLGALVHGNLSIEDLTRAVLSLLDHIFPERYIEVESKAAGGGVSARNLKTLLAENPDFKSMSNVLKAMVCPRQL